ncbi:MAG: hypothetical protein Q8L23_11425 [Caulobacter sp.]|nr:hypothetical protein [Caulobacter sp.]
MADALRLFACPRGACRHASPARVMERAALDLVRLGEASEIDLVLWNTSPNKTLSLAAGRRLTITFGDLASDAAALKAAGAAWAARESALWDITSATGATGGALNAVLLHALEIAPGSAFVLELALPALRSDVARTRAVLVTLDTTDPPHVLELDIAPPTWSRRDLPLSVIWERARRGTPSFVRIRNERIDAAGRPLPLLDAGAGFARHPRILLQLPHVSTRPSTGRPGSFIGPAEIMESDEARRVEVTVTADGAWTLINDPGEAFRSLALGESDMHGLPAFGVIEIGLNGLPSGVRVGDQLVLSFLDFPGYRDQTQWVTLVECGPAPTIEAFTIQPDYVRYLAHAPRLKWDRSTNGSVATWRARDYMSLELWRGGASPNAELVKAFGASAAPVDGWEYINGRLEAPRETRLLARGGSDRWALARSSPPPQGMSFRATLGGVTVEMPDYREVGYFSRREAFPPLGSEIAIQWAQAGLSPDFPVYCTGFNAGGHLTCDETILALDEVVMRIECRANKYQTLDDRDVAQDGAMDDFPDRTFEFVPCVYSEIVDAQYRAQQYYSERNPSLDEQMAMVLYRNREVTLWALNEGWFTEETWRTAKWGFSVALYEIDVAGEVTLLSTLAPGSEAARALFAEDRKAANAEIGKALPGGYSPRLLGRLPGTPRTPRTIAAVVFAPPQLAPYQAIPAEFRVLKEIADRTDVFEIREFERLGVKGARDTETIIGLTQVRRYRRKGAPLRALVS